jgi:hypothetical protein
LVGRWLANAFSVAFPWPKALDDPQAPPPIAVSGVLREGVLLSEETDAASKKDVA